MSAASTVPRVPLQGWAAADRRIREATRWLATAGLLALFLNSLVVVVDIVMRSAFGAPIDRLSDVSATIYYLSAACCIPAATAARRHITIRALDKALSIRAREAVEGFAAVVTATILGMVAWQVWQYAYSLGVHGRTMSQIALPVAPFWYFVATCLSAAFLIQIFILTMHAVGFAAGVATAPAAAAADAEGML